MKAHNSALRTSVGRSFQRKTFPWVRSLLLAALVALGLFVAPKPAHAAACTFTSNVTVFGNWNASGSWTPAGSGCGTYPGSGFAGDTVIIANGDNITLNVSPANAIASLQVGGGTSGSLTLGNSGTSRTLSITGNVTVSSGATLGSGGSSTGHALNIGGNLTNNGTIDLVSSNDAVNLSFNGTGTQTVSSTGSGSIGTLCTVTIATGAYVDTTDNYFVLDTTLAACGTFTQNGILKRTTPNQNINSGSPFTFTDSRNVTTAQITRTGGTLGNTSVAVISNESPNIPLCGNHYLNGSPILRWYDISAASAGTATVRLYYRTSNPNETNGTTASTIRIFHCDGTTWTELGGTTGSDGSGNYVEVTGVTTFSPFALAPGGTPTNVDLAAFRAVTTKNQKVRVKWTTSSELTTVGFNVYRAKKYDGNYKKQNTELIPARHPGELVGDKYKFGNKNVKSGETYFYKLQVVKADGSKEWSEVSQVTIP